MPPLNSSNKLLIAVSVTASAFDASSRRSRLRERLERCWASLPEASAPGMPTLLGELGHALVEVEARLLELWEAPRPVVDFARDGGEAGARPFAVACFGDNADVLDALRPGLSGRVASVYIDPPYDTGTTEFRYGDRYGAHRWLSMMDLRLRRLRALMSPASSIHTSINESRLFELKLLGDEVFGPSNYLGMTTVRVRHDDRILKGHKALHEVTDFLVGFRAGEAHEPGQRPSAAKPDEACWRVAACGEPQGATLTLHWDQPVATSTVRLVQPLILDPNRHIVDVDVSVNGSPPISSILVTPLIKFFMFVLFMPC